MLAWDLWLLTTPPPKKTRFLISRNKTEEICEGWYSGRGAQQEYPKNSTDGLSNSNS